MAAHITAASPGGPRYEATLSTEERNSNDNGIWLCQNCAKLVDNDPVAYTVEILGMWRRLAELAAKAEVERGISIPVDDRFTRVQRDMPHLIAEMRVDLRAHPLARRFVCVRQGWVVWTDALRYSYEEHQDLDDKVRVLENLGLVYDVTRGTNIRYFLITEPFADYLRLDSV